MAIPALLKMLENSIDRMSPDHFEYLVAKAGSQGCELWRWSSGSKTGAKTVQDIDRIGSLTSWHASVANMLVETLRAGKIDEERLLTMATAIVQSFGVRDHLMKQGVGGAIAGVRISANGTHWLSDTNYVLHNAAMANLWLVSVYCRESGVAVRSSFTQDTRFLLGGVSDDEANAWVERWRDELTDAFDRRAAKIWIFVSTSEFSVFAIDAHESVTETPCCKITITGEGRYDFGIHDVLRTALTVPLTDRNDGSFPLRLSYVAAETCLSHAAGWLAARK